ncbi:MAG: OB-fold protein [Bacteroidota bacterium]|jgi:hypothetical protein
MDNLETRKKNDLNKGFLIIIGFLSLLMFGIICGDENENKNDNNLNVDAPAKEIESTAIQFTVESYRLDADYEKNEVDADNKYKGKVISVLGRVESITKDFNDDAVVTLYANNEYFGGVRCYFKNAQDASGLYKRQGVEIVGRVSGKFVGSVNIKDCYLKNKQ